MADHRMTYATAGVNYTPLDVFKREAQEAASCTGHCLRDISFAEVEWSRGESAYLIETPWGYLAHVEEGLGTKNVVADAVYALGASPSCYRTIAKDTVAMIVNDMITTGARPISLAMHLAVGSDQWLSDEKRNRALLYGWQQACLQARCAWGGGETPVLRDVVHPETIVLNGSGLGIVQPKEKLIVPRMTDGDAIVLLESSGIHANGITLARRIAEKLPDGYRTLLPDGRAYGEALLTPTRIYLPVTEALWENRIDVHYAVNVTGHGWRKLMRATEPFIYVIDDPGEVPPLFSFIQECGPVTDEEAYATFNMGAGFALYVPEIHVPSVIEIARLCGCKAWRAGHVEKRGNEKKVVIPSKGIEYSADTLAIR